MYKPHREVPAFITQNGGLNVIFRQILMSKTKKKGKMAAVT